MSGRLFFFLWHTPPQMRRERAQMWANQLATRRRNRRHCQSTITCVFSAVVHEACALGSDGESLDVSPSTSDHM